MKRIYGVVAVVVLAVVGLLPAQTISAASTNNFSISSYDIQYELSRDSESRSVLKTKEMIVAEFPSSNQNHGIERAIPKSYDGHSTSLNITSVMDGTGAAAPYSVYASGDTSVVRIGDKDTYVHGTQTYQIEYSQRDVTKFYQNTGRDEWYWDTNGTQWQVPIDELNVTISVDPSSKLELPPACYQGASGATDACSLQEKSNGQYGLTASNLGAGQNVTVSFGFEKGTFAAYQQSFMDKVVIVWLGLQVVSIPLTIALIIGFSLIWARKKYRIAEQNPIAAEYIPPKDASVVVSSQVIASSVSVFAAQLIDLAVRHYISIVETKAKSTWRSAEYDIVILRDLDELYEEEKEILTDMFTHLPKAGERLSLTELKKDMSYSSRTLDNDKKLQALLNSTYGIFQKSPKDSKFFYRWALALLIVGLLTLSAGFGVAALFIWVYGITLRPLTDKGLLLRRYLLGLNKYIKASETERIKFLQGPDTAQKVGYDVDPNNPGQIVKLYERTLPYAIMYGREKEWGKRLGDFYQQTQTSPDWYTGTGAFNGMVFASTLSSFSTASSYSAGSSSSTGGSSGGGSSGGGGGGGGGGGW
jgi:uncharacterized membrane protein YgcG